MEAKERGNKLFQAGDWSGAAKWYTSALEADPRLVAAYANRAACEIHMQQWEQGLADCNAALALESGPQLQVKVLWRKAVCLRHIGVARDEWTDTVEQGLALDSTNDKLVSEQQHVFVRRTDTTPSKYTRPPTQARAPAQPAPVQVESSLFTPPPRPLSYAGVLKLTRSKNNAAYAFWYNEVSCAELVNAHRASGIEPDTLDYVHEMVARHPQYAEKNAEFMRALLQCARYTSASLLADEALYRAALAAVGESN